MMAKVHERRRADGTVFKVTAICDAKLLGKVLREGDVVLDLETHRQFYEGKKVNGDEAVELVRNAENLNLVGEKALAAARKAGSVSGAKKIAGVPHLQVYRL